MCRGREKVANGSLLQYRKELVAKHEQYLADRNKK